MDFHNFVKLFQSLLQQQTQDTEQNTQLFIQFKDSFPDQFIQHLYDIFINPALCTQLGKQSAIILRKCIIRFPNQLSAYGKCGNPELKTNMYHKMLELVGESKSYSEGKMFADCAALMCKELATTNNVSTAVLIYQFVQQALSQQQLHLKQCAAQIIQITSDFELTVLFALDFQNILNFIDIIIKAPELQIYGVTAMFNIISTAEIQTQSSIGQSNNSLVPTEVKQKLLETSFTLIASCQVQESQIKMVQQLLDFTEKYDINQFIFEYAAQFFQLFDHLFQQSFQQSNEVLFQQTLQSLSNVVDCTSLSNELEPAEADTLMKLVSSYVFTYLQSINVTEVNTGLIAIDYPEQMFDQNSNEKIITDSLQRIFSKYLGQSFEIYKNFRELKQENQINHLYSCHFIINAFITADSFYQDEIRNITDQLKQLCNDIKNYPAVIQFLTIHNLNCILTSHSDQRDIMKHLLQNIDQLLFDVIDSLESPALTVLLDFIINLLQQKRFRFSETIQQILITIVKLLNNNYDRLVIQSKVYNIMTIVLEANRPSLAPIANAYQQYFVQAIGVFNQIAGSMSNRCCQAQINYFISIIKFLAQSLISYNQYTDVQQISSSIIQQIIQTFINPVSEEIHMLMDCLIEFVQTVSPLYSQLFTQYCQYIVDKYLVILNIKQYKEPGLLDNRTELEYQNYLSKQLKLVYKSIGKLFQHIPQQMAPHAVKLVVAIMARDDLGIFSKADSACCLMTYLNCFDVASPDFQTNYQQIIRLFVSYAECKSCAATMCTILEDFDLFINLLKDKQYLYQQSVIIDLFNILEMSMIKNNEQFQVFLVQHQYEHFDDDEFGDPMDDNIPIDQEKDEVCRLGDVIEKSLKLLLQLLNEQQKLLIESKEYPDEFKLQFSQFNNQIRQRCVTFASQLTLPPFQVNILNALLETVQQFNLDGDKNLEQFKFEQTNILFNQLLIKPHNNITLYKSEILFTQQALMQYPTKYCDEQFCVYSQDGKQRYQLSQSLVLLQQLLNKEKSRNLPPIRNCMVVIIDAQLYDLKQYCQPLNQQLEKKLLYYSGLLDTLVTSSNQTQVSNYYLNKTKNTDYLEYISKFEIPPVAYGEQQLKTLPLVQQVSNLPHLQKVILIIVNNCGISYNQKFLHDVYQLFISLTINIAEFDQQFKQILGEDAKDLLRRIQNAVQQNQ